MPGVNLVEVNGTNKCFRFRDGTPPIYGAESQLGHSCRPCCWEGRLAKEIFRGKTPRTRRLLLRREHQNLRMVHALTTLEHRAAMSETEAWRAAMAAKTAERDHLRELRRLDEEHQE